MSLVGTAEDTGYLGAAFRIFTVLAMIPLILVSTAFPVLARAAHRDRERLQYAVQRLVDIALIIGTWMALSTALGAGVAIDIVAGAGLAPAVPVLQIQAAALLFGLSRGHRGTCARVASSPCCPAAREPRRPRGDHRADGRIRSRAPTQGAAVAMLAADTGLVVLHGLVLFGSRVVHYDLELVPRIAVAALASGALVFTPLERIPLVVAATIIYWAVLVVLRGLPT